LADPHGCGPAGTLAEGCGATTSYEELQRAPGLVTVRGTERGSTYR